MLGLIITLFHFELERVVIIRARVVHLCSEGSTLSPSLRTRAWARSSSTSSKLSQLPDFILVRATGNISKQTIKLSQSPLST